MGASEALDSQSTVIIFLLFLSYYWVQQVLQNVMHVTTAGVVGTWYVSLTTYGRYFTCRLDHDTALIQTPIVLFT
jgi:hypothetical protein